MEKNLEFSGPGGIVDAMLYAPGEAGSWPGILYLTDVGGIRPANRAMARRLAGEGYVVLMPNIFHRSARPPILDFQAGPSEEMARRVQSLRNSLPSVVIDADLGAYIDLLLGLPTVAGTKIAVVGYCFTGAWTIRAAVLRPQEVALGASFHGGSLATDGADSPHLLVPKIRGMAYFGHAADDAHMSAEAIARLERALCEADVRHRSETYPARHGWCVPDMAAYDEEQAERHFRTLAGLLARSL